MAKSKQTKKPAPRTPEEKLRGLVNLKVKGTTRSVSLYSQKELGAMLGISERTIRRYKNQKGYKLASRTEARIKSAVNKEDRKIKRLIDAGTALRVETVTIRGKKIRRIVQTKGEQFKLPPSRILQLPVVYPAKAGGSQTFMLDVRGWSAGNIIAEIESAHASRRFGSWHAKVMVPPGVGRSGRKGDGELVDDEPEEIEDEETGEITVQNPKPEFYMIGPFDLKRNRAKIASEINYHTDAGRVIVEINLVENLKRKK